MAARRELLERIENESKAYGSNFESHYLPTWQEFETAVRSLCSQYVLISFSLCHYRASTIDKFSFKNVGSAIPGGLPRAWQKMMQWPRCTPVPELKQDIVWNTPLLSCSWKPPRYGGRSDIMFLKPNWSPLRGLIYAHLTSTLRCHWDCGAHDHVQGVVPMLSIASQCIHFTIPLPLNLFHPVTLFTSERSLRLF